MADVPPPGDDFPLEAYKLLADFAKTIMALGTTLLAAVISYLVLQNLSVWSSLGIPTGIIVLSAVLCVYGYGHCIIAIRDQKQNRKAIWFCNSGFFVLLISIIALPFTLTFGPTTIDRVLQTIQSSDKSHAPPLRPTDCVEIVKNGDHFTVTYVFPSGKKCVVEYAIATSDITQIRDN